MMSESEENHQPGDTVSQQHSSSSGSSRAKQRPGVMEPLKVLCNGPNSDVGDVGLTNGVANDSHKLETSPKPKEPRAKMSLSPSKPSPKLTSAIGAIAGIKRGFARKTMTPDSSLALQKVKEALKKSQSTDSISTSPASSREGSVESTRSLVVKENNSKAEQENNRDDAISETSSVRSSSPGKFPPRARKSLPKESGKEDTKPKPGSNHLTFKLTDLSTKLGLQGESLTKMDAKTLDQLLLKAKKEGMRDNSRANSPAPVSKEKPATPTAVNKVSEETDSGALKTQESESESVKLTPTAETVASVKKKRKRKSGTYNLPSNKKVFKKKKPVQVNVNGASKQKVEASETGLTDKAVSNREENANSLPGELEEKTAEDTEKIVNTAPEQNATPNSDVAVAPDVIDSVRNGEKISSENKKIVFTKLHSRGVQIVKKLGKLQATESDEVSKSAAPKVKYLENFSANESLEANVPDSIFLRLH